MKHTIYATTLNPELFDYRIYDIREDEGNEVYVDGGRDYHDIDNNGYLKAIKQLIKEYNDYYYETYYHNSVMAYLHDMLPRKLNGKRLSPLEANKIKTALDSEDDNKTITICLSIITGKKYHWKPLRGCCQGDYVEAYYPEDTTTEYLDFVEAWFFGTGTEVMVHEDDNEPECAEDIEGWTFYTAEWRIDELKNEIKSQCGFKDTDDVEVKLWLYDHTRTVKIDQYKLVE